MIEYFINKLGERIPFDPEVAKDRVAFATKIRTLVQDGDISREQGTKLLNEYGKSHKVCINNQWSAISWQEKLLDMHIENVDSLGARITELEKENAELKKEILFLAQNLEETGNDCMAIARKYLYKFEKEKK